jgi:hypothetical protein
MILTVLEARVAAANVEALRSAYSVLAAGPLPPGLVSSRLIQAEDDPSLWRLETLWQDREAIERMRAKGTPGGVLLFREVGAEPSLTIFKVVATIAGTS